MNSIELKILEILKLQDRLNINTNGEDWRSGTTNRGKIVNWKRCIYMESCELIDSFSWKHWKNINSVVDRDNIEIELVDILHFIASYLLVHNSYENSVDMIKSFLNEESDIFLPTEWTKDDDLKLDEYLDPFENLLAVSLVKSDDKLYQEELIKLFFLACSCAKLDFDKMFKTYLGKNSLNIFRQDNGYKEGSYIKEWNGIEDNVVLQSIIKDLDSKDSLNFDTIYSKLDSAYNGLNND